MMREQASLGKILSSIRKRRGWTLKEMSAHVAISVSTLSKIENDRATLRFDRLCELARRLNLDMASLFAEGDAPENTPLVTGRRSIGGRSNAVRIRSEQSDCYYLCAELRQKLMVPYDIEIFAGSLAEFGPLQRRNGEEFLHVIEGEIIAHTEFYEPVRLSAGQSLYVDTTMGHAYLRAPDCDHARAIGISCDGTRDFDRSVGLFAADGTHISRVMAGGQFVKQRDRS